MDNKYMAAAIKEAYRPALIKRVLIVSKLFFLNSFAIRGIMTVLITVIKDSGIVMIFSA